jgi:putative DNA primase/helicase
MTLLLKYDPTASEEDRLAFLHWFLFDKEPWILAATGKKAAGRADTLSNKLMNTAYYDHSLDTDRGEQLLKDCRKLFERLDREETDKKNDRLAAVIDADVEQRSRADIERFMHRHFKDGDVILVIRTVADAGSGDRDAGLLTAYRGKRVDDAVAVAVKYNGKHDLYTCLQKITESNLGKGERETVKNEEVERWRDLYIDIDPDRGLNPGKKIPATSDEVEQASLLEQAVRARLKNYGFPAPEIANSGNGFSQHYRLDMEATQENTNLVGDFINAIEALYSGDEYVFKAHIDVNIKNPARITRITGTLNVSGWTPTNEDGTPTYPDRISRYSGFIDVPEDMGLVTVEMLKTALAAIKKALPEDARGNKSTFPIPEVILDGAGRHRFLVSVAGGMRAMGLGANEIYAGLSEVNKQRCRPPKDDADIKVIAASMERYEEGNLAPLTTFLTMGLNDDGNAAYVKEVFEGEMMYCTTNDHWYIWNGKYWKQDDENDTGVKHRISIALRDRAAELTTLNDILAGEGGKVRRPEEVEEAIRKYMGIANRWAKSCLSRSARNNAMDLVKSIPGMYRPLEDFDNAPGFICARNGVVNMATGELIPHGVATKKLCITQMFDADYIPAEKNLAFEAFLLQIMMEDPGLAKELKKVLGYISSGELIEELFYLFVGVGANGKSTLYKILKALLGRYFKAAGMDTFITNGGNRNFGLARLVGARIVGCSELPKGAWLNMPLVKQWTSHDSMVAEEKNKPQFEFTPKGNLIFLCNNTPRMDSSEYANIRRVFIIPFDFVATIELRDKNLAAKLLQSPSGILNVLVEGYQLYKKEGINNEGPGVQKRIAEAINAYRLENDPLGKFINDECETGALNTASAGLLWNVYELWCEENNEYPWSQREFKRRLKGASIHQRHTMTGEKYSGVKLKADELRRLLPRIGLKYMNTNASTPEEMVPLLREKEAKDAARSPLQTVRWNPDDVEDDRLKAAGGIIHHLNNAYDGERPKAAGDLAHWYLERVKENTRNFVEGIPDDDILAQLGKDIRKTLG